MQFLEKQATLTRMATNTRTLVKSIQQANKVMQDFTRLSQGNGNDHYPVQRWGNHIQFD